VIGEMGVFHTVGAVRLSTDPSCLSVASTTYGVIIRPPLATVAATMHMCSGTIRSLPCPNPPMEFSGNWFSKKLASHGVTLPQ
jgi:hypothetical protein